MNNSISTLSPAWPTRWPSNSFPLWPTLLVIALVIVAGGVVLLLAGIWFVATYRDQILAHHVPLVPAIVVQLLIEAIVAAIILVALPRLSGFSLKELGFALPSWRVLGWAILGAIAMAIVADGGSSLVQSLTHTKHEQSTIEMFKALSDPATIRFFAFFAIVLAPMAEELIFRVFAFNIGLRFLGFVPGAIVSGSLFALAHWDAFAFLPLMLGGMVLCWVYYHTRNVFASMISHGLFNSLTIVALLYAPKLISP